MFKPSWARWSHALGFPRLILIGGLVSDALGVRAAAQQTSRGVLEAADGVRLCFEVTGSGTEVLVIPLRSSMAADFAPFVGGRRVVYYDPRGRGCSTPAAELAELGINADVRDLEAMRQHLGIERMALLGWSYFGAVVARYAMQYPARVTRLIQIGPLPARRLPYFEQGVAAVMTRLDRAALSAAQALTQSPGGRQDPTALCRAWNRAILPAYVGDPKSLNRMRSDPCADPNEHPLTLNPVLSRLWNALGDWDWRVEVTGLTVPTLVIQGDRDFQPLDGTREWVARGEARLLVLEGAGHMAWLDRPEAVFDAVNRFLAGEWPTGSRAGENR